MFLLDLRRFSDGLAPRKGDNYFEEGPYFGGKDRYLESERRLPFNERIDHISAVQKAA